MKTILRLAWIMNAAFVCAQIPAAPTSPNSSSAEKAVLEAKRSTAAKPELFADYNRLALALVQRGQETADSAYYVEAQDAVKKSLSLAPGNFDTKKVEAALLLAEHEYPAALEAATALNKKVPDDVTVYGLLTDADIALGKYDDAEKAAQWMLNLRPGNVPALTRAAHLRELFGDAEGSTELLNMVLESTSPEDTGERAGVLAELGHLRLSAGETDRAEQVLQQALKVNPNSADALENLAAVRSAQKRYDEAASLLRQSYAVAPRTERLYLLGAALALGKHDAEATKAFAKFEVAASASVHERMNSNVQLVFYYADQAHMPGQALAVATQEYSWRRDVYTLDAYAWALHVNGKDDEARKEVGIALGVGIQDASMFYHAGKIALKLGDRATAERYLKQSRDLNTPASEPALRASSSVE
jgi:tetratricopeptide (TPR) repeat protein